MAQILVWILAPKFGFWRIFATSQDGGQPSWQHRQQDDGSDEDAEPRKPRHYGHETDSHTENSWKVARFSRLMLRLESSVGSQ